jgi:hypothetical protein
MKTTSRLAAIASAVLTLAACSRSNNVLLGRVEADINGHRVAVTNCYQFFGIPEPQKFGEGNYRYSPCKGTTVALQGNSLFVNGTAYGDLGPEDSVTVDNGKVLINGTRQ